MKNLAFVSGAVFSFIILLLVSASSEASPKLGDHVEFLMNGKSGGKNIQVKIESDVVSFDELKKLYTVKETQTPLQPAGAPAETTLNEVPVADLMSDFQIDDMLKNCTTLGGKLDGLKVPAGSFQTCKISGKGSDATQTLWYGKVPQGIVKSVMKDAESGFTTQLELSGYQYGQ